MSTNRSRAPAALLAEAHRSPGTSRAEAARRLGMPTGHAAETAARLATGRLLSEGPGPATGRRGRPTTTLLPHPEGPLVAVAVVAHESWRVVAVELGGTAVASTTDRHHGELAGVLDGVSRAWLRLHRRFGARLRAWVVGVPGTVMGARLVQAPNLGWHGVDLEPLRPRPAPGPLLAGNDATLAGVAEHRRGAAAGTATAVHLYLDAGIGGCLIADDLPVLGTSGSGGEFGHLPFGSDRWTCACGARGCWNTTLDGAAIARHLGAGPPRDPVTYTREVFAAAAAGRPAERRAVQAVARSLGRGAAGLVNALDPEMVTVGGLGPELLSLAGEATDAAYRRALMAFRADGPPPIRPALLGADAPVTGAAEEGFALLLTDEGVEGWLAEQDPPG